MTMIHRNPIIMCLGILRSPGKTTLWIIILYMLVVLNWRGAALSLPCIILSFQFSFEPIFLDHFGRFLTNHERHCIGVAGRYHRHDRSVDHPETFDAANSEFRVHNSVRVSVRPHLAGAWLVVQVGGHESGGTHPISIRHKLLVFTAGEWNRQQPRTVFLERRSVAHCNSLGKKLTCRLNINTYSSRWLVYHHNK